MSFVLDCSMAMSWCFSDERTDYSDRVLSELPISEIDQSSKSGASTSRTRWNPVIESIMFCSAIPHFTSLSG